MKTNRTNQAAATANKFDLVQISARRWVEYDTTETGDMYVYASSDLADIYGVHVSYDDLCAQSIRTIEAGSAEFAHIFAEHFS